MVVLHRIEGDLHIEQVSLREIAETHDTPCFVYSEDAITAAYRAFQDAFSMHPHRICYAVKANSNLAILQTLAALGSGFDIVSGGELARVLKAGGDPGSVVFSGVGKQDWEILFALEQRISCFNVESASELRRIARLAAATDAIAPISIRVNPDVDPNTHPYISTGLKENKFGVSVEEAMTLYQEATGLDSLKVVGVDCHIGSQITELTPFLDALTRVLALVDELEARAITLQHIDLGGGIGVQYQDEVPIEIGAFASAIGQAMGGRPQSLMFEPGRMIVANAGVLLTTVNTLKGNDEKNFAVVDAAMNDLIRPALYSAWQKVTPVTLKGDDASPEKHWDIVGPICETGDFLAKNRMLSLEEDDLLAILSAGAYGFVMSSNYNSRPRSAEVLVSGEEHYCVRKRETIEDLFALESMKPVS
ncbi:MAG: diaminopimelate decarboxylase [Gammaproteobacteria bacterium]|nr:diaminopimelate decarboxylase [Gammaproteobacteria bacterium]MBT5725409.1 diaminopimelate decarboxylase [Gammaproteobacteria bacterium]